MFSEAKVTEIYCMTHVFLHRIFSNPEKIYSRRDNIEQSMRRSFNNSIANPLSVIAA
jgi:hypothetical protein